MKQAVQKNTAVDPFAGLSDMLSGGLDPLAASGDQQCALALDQIVIKKQIREEFEDEEQTIEDLAESIRRQGVLQPIRVRPLPNGTWELVCGERRYRASKLADLAEIPVIWREMTDEEAEDAQLAENIHRKNLKQIETAKKLQKDLDSGLSVEEVMAKHSVNRSWLSKVLSLLKLPEQAKRLVSSGLTSDVEAINTVKTIEKVNPQAAKDLVDKVEKAGKGKINVRDEADKVKREVKPPKKDKPGGSGVVATPKNRDHEAPGDVTVTDGGSSQTFSPTDALNRAFGVLTSSGVPAKMVIDTMSADDTEVCEGYLRGYYDLGMKAKPGEVLRIIAKSMREGSFGDEGEALFALLAYVAGLDPDCKFSMLEILGAVK